MTDDSTTATAPTTASSQVDKTEEAKRTRKLTEEHAFPAPKYVVTIVSPRTIELHESDASLDEWKEFEEDTPDETTTTVLNLHVLLVSLLNRLLRARLFPRRAVHSFITSAASTDGQESIVFSILTPPSVLPILLSKCEHFGIGNFVGLVYVVPLETCIRRVLTNDMFEEGEEELLSVPSQFDRPMSIDTAVSSIAGPPPSDLASNTSDAVLVRLGSNSTKKKTPQPVALRQSVSETRESGEEDSAESDTPTLRRSNSHPDIIQTSDDKPKVEKEEVTKKRETPLLEIIPEAKVPVEDNKEKKIDKSVLIQKVLDARMEWLATASRIRVEQVADEVSAAAALTWDYLLFVVCAAAISATGLATNSSVTVLASMLVSPIMGPVLAVTFGTMIQRPAMIRTALRNEAISLLLCILVGAFGGLVAWWTRIYESENWPSNEMIVRGDPTGLFAGVLVALPSGMATALSTLGKNSSGLVGVAISLSLLPPAVNAGLCWMFALLEGTRLVDREPDDDTNYWRIGSTSFGLTLVNIVCIWMAGVFTFWLKEVAPVEHKNAFWSRDLKIARQKKNEGGAGKIKDGLEAAFDLKKKYNASAGEQEPDQSNHHQFKPSRRRLANSHWEDAIFFDQSAHGGKARGRVLRRSNSEGILSQTTALGGIEKASETLFNNTLFSVGGNSIFGPDDDGELTDRNKEEWSYLNGAVPPEDVVHEILLQNSRCR